jgi:hypothetical protein
MRSTVLSYAQSRIRAAAGDQVARISRDVWLPMPLAAEDLSRWAALLTVLPPGSVLSGRTAAAVHGLWLPPDGRQVVDVTVPVTGAERPPAPRRRGVRARRRVLRLDDCAGWRASLSRRCRARGSTSPGS